MSFRPTSKSSVNRPLNIIETFPKLSGFYVLTSSGELGSYDPNKKFIINAVLSKEFADHNREFVRLHLQNPDAEGCRVAIIYRAGEKRAWGPEIFLLETPIVRSLYPVSGTKVGELTAFQKKNREMSVYRGMEILLEHQSSALPDTPVYCPVLFDRHTTLDQYASLLGREAVETDKTIPVIEVLNLAATIPIGRRKTPKLLVLRKSLYEGVVKKDMRKYSGLSVIEKLKAGTDWAEDKEADEVFHDVDKRTDRGLTLPTGGEGSVNASSPGSLVIEQYLKGPIKNVEPEMLRAFVRFRALSDEKLRLLASKSPVYQAPGGARLIERGKSDSWSFFLLEGALELLAADGARKLIEGGTEQASSPVSYLKPRMYTVNAVTPVKFLWIHDTLIEKILSSN